MKQYGATKCEAVVSITPTIDSYISIKEKKLNNRNKIIQDMLTTKQQKFSASSEADKKPL